MLQQSPPRCPVLNPPDEAFFKSCPYSRTFDRPKRNIFFLQYTLNNIKQKYLMVMGAITIRKRIRKKNFLQTFPVSAGKCNLESTIVISKQERAPYVSK